MSHPPPRVFPSLAAALAPPVSLTLVAVGVTASLGPTWGAFGPATLRFWGDGLVLGGSWLAAVVAWLSRSPRTRWLTAAALTAPAGALLAAGLTGAVRFPATVPSLWVSMLALGGLWLLVSGGRLRAHPRGGWGLVMGAAAGALHLLARVPPPAATRPLASASPPAAPVHAPAVELPCGPGTLRVLPLLTFASTSADGFWPGLGRKDPAEGEAALASSVELRPDGVDAVTHLPHAVASHLNRFADVHLWPLERPALRFAATGARTFPLAEYDYPVGRPVSFAYVTAQGELVVARATSAEKGPFTELARGPLPGDRRVELTVMDGDAPLCTLAFLDFAAQADVTTLSPTAGRGLPPNVIQFGRPPRAPGRGWIHLSLAETGIGAGRDTVWHAAGGYLNRIRVRSATPSSRPGDDPAR